MIVAIISSIIMAFSDRWFGTERKILGQLFGTFAISCLALYHFDINYNAPDWLFVPIVVASFVSFLSLRQWGIWGELFPNTNKDQITKHYWFVKLVNRCTGMRYSTLNGDELIRWKRIAWGFRYAIYGLPLALLFCLCGFTLVPLLLLPIAGLIRGVIYDYGLNQGKELSWCELYGGGVAFLIIGLSL